MRTLIFYDYWWIVLLDHIINFGNLTQFKDMTVIFGQIAWNFKLPCTIHLGSGISKNFSVKSEFWKL